MRSGKWLLIITGLWYLLFGEAECFEALRAIINEGISVRFAINGIVGVVFLFTGIVGIIFRKSYSKAVFLILLGIANLGMNVVTQVIFPPVNPIAVILSLPIPALYIYGAYRNL